MPMEMKQKAPEQNTVKRESREGQKDINRTGIPDGLKQGVEAVSGLSFDDVRVHYSSRNPEKFYANAYTQGSHVYIGPGKESSLPHELGHIIQQKQKRVRPTLYLGRTAINNDQALEKEADRLGAMALRQKPEVLPEKTVESTPDGASPVQMDPNVKFGERMLLGPPQKQPKQEPSPDYPLMVYETFGNKENELVKVYLQSCQYPGKTVCILGMNQRYRISEFKKVPVSNMRKLQDQLANQLAGSLQRGHEAYIIPFIWRSVGGGEIETEENGAAKGKRGAQAVEAAFNAADRKLGYTLPYYEVRGHLMEEAEAIVVDRGEENVLFRWIDRDATEDNSHELNSEELTEMAQSEIPEYLSGIYKWDKVSGDPLRNDFLMHFNDAERDLREKWYELNKKLSSGSKLFYMPEPILVMNWEAHNIAKGQLAHRALETQQARHVSDAVQDKESMAAFYGDSKDNVRFNPRFSVHKPIKTVTYTGKSYLQQLEDMVRQNSAQDFVDFCKVLSGVRQSAFDNGQWAFIQEGDFGEWYNESRQEVLRDACRNACRERRMTRKEAQMAAAQLQLNSKRLELATALFEVYNS